MDTDIRTASFDPAEHLDADGLRDLLKDALESGDEAFLRHALKTLFRARGTTQLAHHAGITQEALETALDREGDPKVSTLLQVLKALGIKLAVAPVEDEQVPA